MQMQIHPNHSQGYYQYQGQPMQQNANQAPVQNQPMPGGQVIMVVPSLPNYNETPEFIEQARVAAYNHALAGIVLGSLCNPITLSCAVPGFLSSRKLGQTMSHYTSAKCCGIAAIVLSVLTGIFLLIILVSVPLRNVCISGSEGFLVASASESWCCKTPLTCSLDIVTLSTAAAQSSICSATSSDSLSSGASASCSFYKAGCGTVQCTGSMSVSLG